MDTCTHDKSVTKEQYLAVVDTETNWNDEVISIGIVVASKETYQIVTEKYYVITPECNKPSMYGYALNEYAPLKKCKRSEAMSDLRSSLVCYNVGDLFAYNARFDYNHLPELEDFVWHDIVRKAAYKQYNPYIPDDLECWKTGRLKNNYGVKSIMHMLLKGDSYVEKHNALYDAKDELTIMRLLGYPTEQYPSIQETAVTRKSPYTRRELHALQKAELEQRLSQESIELIYFESTKEPITIKCKKCNHSWDLNYYTAKNRIPNCPQCTPIVRTQALQKKSKEERLWAKARDYAELISSKSAGTLKVVEYRGASQKATVMCLTCLHIWDIRPDHLKTRCYCPQCKKKAKAAMI